MESKYPQIAEQILRLFSGGDPSDDSELDPREIELLVAQAHATLIKTDYFVNIKSEDFHGIGAENYQTFVGIPLAFDSARKEDYVILPAQYISLPGNKGIHEVRPSGKPNALPIIPLPPGVNSLLEGTRSGGMNGRFMYYPEADRLYFKLKDAGCKLPFTSVNIRLATPSGASVSLGQELAIMAEVTKLMAQRRPQDKVNDNNAQA